MEKIKEYLIQQLAQREVQGLRRQLPPPLTDMVDFCSNDYLGYAQLATSDLGRAGATGSRLISGNSTLAEQVEEDLAQFFGAEAGLLFNAGYAANTGLLSAIATRQDTIIYDKLAHASIRDGLRLSDARTLGFRHNDMVDLQRKLQQAQGRVYVVVESVYSMDGDIAPLAELLPICEQSGAALIVDEAHGTGVIGNRGEGLVAQLGLQDRVWARVHTFGKALGGHGAVVLGSNLLRDFLINFARPFIYSTAAPPQSLVHLQQVLPKMAAGMEIARLRELVTYFKQQLPDSLSQKMIPSDTPIQALVVPGNATVMALARRLQGEGLAVLPIRSPTVPAGQERLRICLHAFNTEAEIERLVGCLGNGS